MKNFFLISLLIISQLFNQCNGQNKSSVKGFIVESKFPEIDTIINNQWEVREYTPMVTKIFYYEDRMMVQQSFFHTNIKTINGVVVQQDPEEMRYYSFIFSKNAVKGVLYDSSNLQTARVVNKDSVLKKISSLNDDVKEIFETTHHQLISSVVQPNGDLVEEYSLISKSDTSMTGSCRLRFSGKDLQTEYYQLSPYIENERKMRLIEFLVINNARSLGPGKMSINRIELPISVRDLKINNEQEIQQMFNDAKEKLK